MIEARPWRPECSAMLKMRRESRGLSRTNKLFYYFREFVDTLSVALLQMEKSESSLRTIHPIVVREETIPFPEAVEIGSFDRGCDA